MVSVLNKNSSVNVIHPRITMGESKYLNRLPYKSRLSHFYRNVARACFQRKTVNQKDFLFRITTPIHNQYHPPITTIHTNLSVILRVFHSDERIDSETFTMGRDTYQLILAALTLSSITPTPHKVLTHSPQLIELYNGGGV